MMGDILGSMENEILALEQVYVSYYRKYIDRVFDRKETYRVSIKELGTGCNDSRSAISFNKEMAFLYGKPIIHVNFIGLDYGVELNKFYFISPLKYKGLVGYPCVQNNDILITKELMSRAKHRVTGDAVIYTKKTPMIVTDSVLVFRPFNPSLSRYLVYFMQTSFYKEMIKYKINGTGNTRIYFKDFLSATKVPRFGGNIEQLNELSVEELEIVESIKKVDLIFDSLRLEIKKLRTMISEYKRSLKAQNGNSLSYK